MHVLIVTIVLHYIFALPLIYKSDENYCSAINRTKITRPYYIGNRFCYFDCLLYVSNPELVQKKGLTVVSPFFLA